MLVLCGRAVLPERVNKPYMICKQHQNIGKMMAAYYYGCPVQRDLEDHLFISGRFPALVVAILIWDYQKLPITGKQGIFEVAKQWRCTGSFNVWLLKRNTSSKNWLPIQMLLTSTMIASDLLDLVSWNSNVWELKRHNRILFCVRKSQQEFSSIN